MICTEHGEQPGNVCEQCIADAAADALLSVPECDMCCDEGFTTCGFCDESYYDAAYDGPACIMCDGEALVCCFCEAGSRLEQQERDLK